MGDAEGFIEDDNDPDSPGKNLDEQEYEAMLAQQKKPSFPDAEPPEGFEPEH